TATLVSVKQLRLWSHVRKPARPVTPGVAGSSRGELCYILPTIYESDALHRRPRVFGDVRSLVRPRNSGPRGGSSLAAGRKYGYFHSLLAASLEALGPCAAGQLSGWQQDHSVRRPRDVKEIAHR